MKVYLKTNHQQSFEFTWFLVQIWLETRSFLTKHPKQV